MERRLHSVNVIVEQCPAGRAKLFTRFWSRVDIRGPQECWEWQGGYYYWGYGQVSGFSDGKQRRAHRVAYFWAYGSIPKGQQVHHSCDNPPCCNPAHLWTGTQADNMQDMASKRRANGKGVGGRPKSLSKKDIHDLQQRYARRDLSITQLVRQYGISKTTMYRYIAEAKCAKNVD